MAHKLRSKHFKTIGIDSNKTISISLGILNKHYKRLQIHEQLNIIQQIQKNPQEFLDDEILSILAEQFIEPDIEQVPIIELQEEQAPLNIFGSALIKENAIEQMKTAMSLPVSARGALMPDSHLGYGLPIGAVLATQGVIIPYAIGMDIGCRMSLSLYPANARFLKKHEHKFKESIVKHTAFGISNQLSYRQEHEFLDRDVFNTTPLLKRLKSKAARQLGSSGSGNHFVEWGLVEIHANANLDIPSGTYIGLLAHSGSRGFGASIAKSYAEEATAMSRLPHHVRHLSWLELDGEMGQEYWAAMQLAGDYARACHDCIHKNVAKHLGLKAILKIENHHNFAWSETYDNKTFVVHRKGATPAGKDVLGIIPGSMTDPGYIVRGLGHEAALNSASHGAGRKHSRKETKSRTTKSAWTKALKNQDITLIGGALDEAPFAYKKLDQVMAQQSDLVETIGKFFPKIVRMDKDR